MAGAQRLTGAIPSGTGEIEEVRAPVGSAGAEDLDQPALLEREQPVVHESERQPDRGRELTTGADALNVERLEQEIDDELL